MVDQFSRDRFAAATGRVYRLEDIEGVGPKTANRIRSATGASTPKEVSEYSAEQLMSKVSGIGSKTAERVIREAGGDPYTKKHSGRNPMMQEAPKSMRMFSFGDFNIDISDKDSAEAAHEQRSAESQRIDERMRAPITTDLDKWKDNPDKYDYPGVDTPTGEPDAKRKDLPFIDPIDVVDDERDSLF